MQQDWFCGPNGWCKTGQNDWYSYIVLWFIPNTPWIYVTAILAYKFTREIAGNLLVASKVSAGAAKGGAARKAKAN